MKHDIVLRKKGDYQNVILVETIKALNNGLIPVMFRKGFQYEWKNGCPNEGDVWDEKLCICPIKKEFIDIIGIKLSDNPDFEDVSKLEFALRETIWGRHFMGLDIVKFDEIDSLMSFYEKDKNNIVQNLQPQDIFNAYWNKSNDKPEPTGKFKEMIDHEEDELPF